MDHKAMQQALMRNKAKGLDITILLGAPGEQVEHGNMGDGPSDEDESKELNLAPDATPLGQEQDEKDETLGHLGHDKNMTPGEELINPTAMSDKQVVEQEMAKHRFGKGSLAHQAMKMKQPPGKGMMAKK